LINGFSKKLENHMAAIAHYIPHYGFCRVREVHRVTPATQLVFTDHVWTIGDLVEAAPYGTIADPVGELRGRFTVFYGRK
jgi:hypothetical protein